MKNQDAIRSDNYTESQQQEILLIRKIIENKIFERREAIYSSGLFTPNALIITVHGIRLIGEAELKKFIEKSNESHLANVSVKNEVIDVIFIRPDVAIVSAIQNIKVKDHDSMKEAGNGSFTFVMVKERGTWVIAAAQNTLIQQLPFDWNG
jgi:uncharacterized protein (TIGR02246 family)